MLFIFRDASHPWIPLSSLLSHSPQTSELDLQGPDLWEGPRCKKARWGLIWQAGIWSWDWRGRLGADETRDTPNSPPRLLHLQHRCVEDQTCVDSGSAPPLRSLEHATLGLLGVLGSTRLPLRRTQNSSEDPWWPRSAPLAPPGLRGLSGWKNKEPFGSRLCSLCSWSPKAQGEATLVSVPQHLATQAGKQVKGTRSPHTRDIVGLAPW